MNKLYEGDNLDILRRYLGNATVDLVYIDPPFNSDAVYVVNIVNGEEIKPNMIAQAFDDTWRWDDDAERVYHEIINKNEKISDLVLGLNNFLEKNKLMGYLVMMAPRLMEIHRVLKPTGALYLHCDPAASHYLKLLLDAIFGIENFQNEIVWCYTIGGKSKKRFAKKHDTIFFYSKSKDYVFNGSSVTVPRPHTHMKIEIGPDGKEYQVKTDAKTKKVYKYPVDEGKIPEDYWLIETLNREERERNGYPTQKPEKLLERIIKASSNEGDLVLDAFCGSGTTLSVAQRLNRRWIGMDASSIAIEMTKERLLKEFGKCFQLLY